MGGTCDPVVAIAMVRRIPAAKSKAIVPVAGALARLRAHDSLEPRAAMPSKAITRLSLSRKGAVGRTVR